MASRSIKIPPVFKSIRFLLPALCLLLSPSAGFSETRLERAKAFYEIALSSHEQLKATPIDQQTREQFLAVSETYRRVYFTDPSYGNNTLCLMAIGDLRQEMGRRWNVPKDLEVAVAAYEFLVKEYPGSKFRKEALMTAALIYREDLRQQEKALEQYEKYLESFGKSADADKARLAKDEILNELAARKKELEVSSPSLPATNGLIASNTGSLVRILDVRHWDSPDYGRVVIDMEDEVQYEMGSLENPPRVYIDLRNARASSKLVKSPITVDSDLLKSIRVGQFKSDTSRIVMDLKGPADYTLFELPNPQRLVIDIREKSITETAAVIAPPETQPQPASLPNSSEPSASTASVDSASSSARTDGTEKAEGKIAAIPLQNQPVVEPPAPSVAVTRPAQRNSNGAHSLTRALGLKVGRIILDPGHGGHDTGAIGPSGLLEKEVVLDIAKRLGKLLEERLGSEVVHTRIDDTFISLESRPAMANEMHADLFVSIHMNSSANPKANGIETYYLNFTTDPEALEVAARENAVSKEKISQLEGLVQKIAMSEKIDESHEFATHVQKALGQSLAAGKRRRLNRGVKKAPFVVLVGANMPSILAEISFLSNPEEEKQLRTDEQRQKIAESLFAGVLSYAETLGGVEVASRETADTP